MNQTKSSEDDAMISGHAESVHFLERSITLVVQLQHNFT